MKKLTAALLSLLFVPTLALAQVGASLGTIAGLPQAAGVVATGAPQYRADGTAGVQLADREGNTKEVLGHAEYTEPTRRGKVFTLAANAYTIIANNASAGLTDSFFKPIVGFYNPLGSGVVAIVLNHKEYHTSGTPGGPLMWNFYCGVNWSSAASGTIYNNLLSNTTPNGSAMVAVNNTFVGTTPVSSVAMKVLGVASGPTTGASALGENGQSIDHKGSIAVPPGCLLALASTATGTSDVVNASIAWEEVAQ